MEKQAQTRIRLVLVPCPYQGHINPMLQLATILHSRGFSISIVHTQFHAPSSENHPDFEFISLPDSLSDDLISSGNVSAILVAVNANFHEPLTDCLVQMMQSEKERGKVACIIYDELMWGSEAVANSLGLSSIMLRTNTVSAQLGRNLVLQLMRDGLVPLQDSLLQEPVPDHYPLRYKDLPVSHFKPAQNFEEIVTKISDVRSSSAVIWNTMFCLEDSLLEQVRQRCSVPNFAVGPMHKFAPCLSSSLLAEDFSCMSWLDKKADSSVLYVSLGSIACISENELSEMAWGLLNSKVPFLWVVRPGLVAACSKWEAPLPRGFKEAVGDMGCIVEWAPQKEVLAHKAVGGFWSHCGWNSVVESISAGVPFICRPSFGDQRVTARYVTHVWKVGLHLEDELKGDEVVRVVRRLMTEQEGTEIRKTALELRKAVENSTIKGGSSFNDLENLFDMIRSF
uniref:UDP-glycosyltransferase 1 n=1 Tax=Linum usitatissimum TaxID=4006 RepID=I2BH71_LINUS|nr:UDP-glycosyltransferase 1 [Linum usitatissimum]